MTDGWIVVPSWADFQHYADRDPLWIKLYLRLRNRDEWRSLTLAQRGLLVSIWIEYAASGGQLRSSDVPGLVLQKLPRKSLDALCEAGFIEVSASRPLAAPSRARADARSRETETEREPPPTPSADAEGENGRQPLTLTAKELRRFTGCKRVRGSHGLGYKRDPLGTDKPPADWPHEPPTKAEVAAALAREAEEESF
jgi:hypothetical protein